MSAAGARVRYRVIDRSQVSVVSLDEQLPADHAVRLLWEFVGELDLSAFERPHKAVEGHAGASVIPSRLLLTLWLFALTEGIGSARRLAELCTRDLPYQWLCGGQTVNYHTLADFYADNGPAVERAFVEHIAVLTQQNLIDLWQVTLDGRKVRANASKESNHRQKTLEKHQQEAHDHLQQLKDQQDDPSDNPRRQAARRRAARERQQRLQQAIDQVRQRQEQRRRSKRSDSKPEDARASETDPDAAKMKMQDGSYHMAYNVETVAETCHGLIINVGVTNQGSDNGQLRPRLEQTEQQQGLLPGVALVDSGFADQPDVDWAEGQGVTVLMPPRNEQADVKAGRDPYARKKRDSEAVANWRARMGTAEAKKQYKRRAPVAEGIHAQQANRGWYRFRLRGLDKVQAEACWQAWAQNLRRILSLGWDLVGTVRAARA